MIPKRVTWFAVGAAAGAGGSLYARRKTRQAWEKVQPTNVVKVAAGKAKGAGRSVADAVREGRSAMRDKEAELREAQDLRLTPRPATVNHSPTFIVVDAAAVLDDEYRARASGPRRRSRRTR
jgi:hypothetical protein